jgi:hypothetical protein
LLYAWKFERKEVSTYNVKVIRRHGETSQFASCDNNNKNEIEIENIVAKLLRPVSVGGTPRITTLK